MYLRIVFCLDVILVCLAATPTRVTAAKQTIIKLLIHSSKRNGRLMLYKWCLGITILALLQGILGLLWHGKKRKIVKCIAG